MTSGFGNDRSVQVNRATRIDLSNNRISMISDDWVSKMVGDMGYQFTGVSDELDLIGCVLTLT